MKYVLVDKLDNITTSAELASNVGLSGAKTYFLGIKKLEEKEFDKLWKVMSEKEYNNQFRVSLQNSGKQYEWWKEEKEIIDDELRL